MAFNRITTDVLAAIIDIVRQEWVITSHADLEKYSHDETEDLSYYPEVVVKPRTTDEAVHCRLWAVCYYQWSVLTGY
jgi:glycolate oxidase